MINLLLEEDRKEIRRDYLLRLGATALMLLAVFSLLSAVFLVPALALSLSKEGSLRERVLVVEGGAALRREDPSVSVLLDFKGRLELLLARQAKQSTGAALMQVLAARPSGVSISRLFFERHLDGSADIAIGGLAETREALLLFERRLRDDPLFASVVLPVSNLASDRNIEFSMTVQGTL